MGRTGVGAVLLNELFLRLEQYDECLYPFRDVQLDVVLEFDFSDNFV